MLVGFVFGIAGAFIISMVVSLLLVKYIDDHELEHQELQARN